MIINSNREVEIFNHAYNLGFHAGQLDWRRQMITEQQEVQAYLSGVWIALQRGNLDQEEYAQIIDRKEAIWIRKNMPKLTRGNYD